MLRSKNECLRTVNGRILSIGLIVVLCFGHNGCFRLFSERPLLRERESHFWLGSSNPFQVGEIFMGERDDWVSTKRELGIRVYRESIMFWLRNLFLRFEKVFTRGDIWSENDGRVPVST